MVMLEKKLFHKCLWPVSESKTVYDQVEVRHLGRLALNDVTVGTDTSDWLANTTPNSFLVNRLRAGTLFSLLSKQNRVNRKLKLTNSAHG